MRLKNSLSMFSLTDISVILYIIRSRSPVEQKNPSGKDSPPNGFLLFITEGEYLLPDRYDGCPDPIHWPVLHLYVRCQGAACTDGFGRYLRRL